MNAPMWNRAEFAYDEEEHVRDTLKFVIDCVMGADGESVSCTMDLQHTDWWNVELFAPFIQYSTHGTGVICEFPNPLEELGGPLPDHVMAKAKELGFEEAGNVMRKCYEVPKQSVDGEWLRVAAGALADGDFVVTTIFETPPDYELDGSWV